MKNPLLALVVLVLFGCNKSTQSHTSEFTEFYDQESVQPLDTESLGLDAKVILSLSPLLNFRESLLLTVSGRFLNLDNKDSVLEIFAYSDKTQLSGSFIQLSPSDKSFEEGTLNIDLVTAENNYQICNIRNAVYRDGSFNFSIQFDNSLTGSNITLWTENNSSREVRNLNNDIFNLQTASCKTRGLILINSLGTGNFWGYIPSAVRVQKMLRELPYDL